MLQFFPLFICQITGNENRRDLIILFNFALFVAASSFLYSQSFGMAVVIILCLLSCLIGLYRIQTSEFQQSQQSPRIALQQDAKYVGRFVLYALPFLFCYSFSFRVCHRFGISQFQKIKA